ncbi:MAG: GAF domain-containing protein [Acidobacteriota bacterium]|nr:GAF domain-containing protein [Acidobacteriota bacterium]
MPDDAALIELATLYYSCANTDSLLRTFAARLGVGLGAGAVHVWLPENSAGLMCRARWSEPGAAIEPESEPDEESPLHEAMEGGETLEWRPEEEEAGELGHLAAHDRERVKAALYLPLPGPRAPLGVAEVLNPRRGTFDLRFAREAARITALALEHCREQESSEHRQLLTIERLTSLYDLSRVFNSTLELSDVLPVVAEKIRDILRAQAVNVWLVDPATNELRFAEQSGQDPTTEEGERCALGKGLLGKAADRGEPVLVEKAEDEEALEERREKGGEFTLESLVAAPLRMNDRVLGIVEAVNKEDHEPFDEEELFFLASVSEQAAIAIHNAQLLEAERKVHTLDALLKISREITSTLNLDHVLAAVVQHAASVVPFDRCAIGYFDRGRFVLGAVSGEEEIPKTPEMEDLRRLLELVAAREEPVSANHREEGWALEPEKEGFSPVEFLERYEYEGFYAVPLRDEQGALGALVLVSSEADFLSRSQRETVGILTGQATVAVRNAQLYQQVPLAGFLRPLARKQQRLMTMPRGRWLDAALKIGAVALLLAIVPWKLRVGADSSVVPAQRRLVTSEVSGLVQQVLVREGSRVQAGEELAQLQDTADRLDLVRSRTQLGLAQRALSDAEFHDDTAAASRARLDVERYTAEAQLYNERLEMSRLRSPIAGVVVTPHVEEKVGERVQPGDRFCEVVERDQMAVEMRVPETDIGLLRAGSPVALKLNSFPTVTFGGTVERVGEQTSAAGGEQYFLVRALFENRGDLARDGMIGQAKITAAGGYEESGWYPVGYVLFRAPARWVWETFWSWMP